MNYNQILNKGEIFLKKNKIQTPLLDAELILAKVLKKRREDLLINLDNTIRKYEILNFNKLLSRRKKKEPIAYILGYKHFWKSKFIINNSVLIPRPDTELIIEESLKYLPIDKSKKILDIGTGSGCIIISLLKERARCVATAIDISIKAINVAKSNPPYINNVDLSRLDDDIKFHEPRIALSGGCDGLRDIKKVIIKSKKLLKIKGKLILEIGSKQKNQLTKILNENGYYINKISKDFSGNDRCIVSTKIY